MSEDSRLRPQMGVAFQTDKPLSSYGPLAAAAEHYGFDVTSVFGDLYFQPPLAPLLEMARATTRVRLGAACFNPFTVHPVEIAGQVAALDQASEGRAYLGMARGSWLSGLGIPQLKGGAALAAMGEAVAVVRALLGGDHRGVEGTYFRLPPGDHLHYRPYRARVPLLVGTWGPQLAAFAGREADELKLGGSANPAMVPVVRAWLDEAAREAGRAAGAVGTVVGAVTVVDADGRAARLRARREVAMYLDVVGSLDRTGAAPPEVLAGVRHALCTQGAEAAGACIPDEVLEKFCFAGTPDQVADHAHQLLAAGAARVDFGSPHGLTPHAGLELLGRRVLPALRASLEGR